ncbi:MAG: tetratricopeptide repeat protein [Anaerolineae bacterium]|nr:tetratricopeptide repeat protein [Anaerolineae bacterium]
MNTVEIIAHRYRLGEQLGAGGMGAVYRAYDRLNGTEVALKQVNIPLEFLEFMSRASLGATNGLWTALAEEFKTLASLRHPHIISVLDYGFDTHRQPFYTMELLTRPATLLNYGADKSIPDKINLIIQVLQALAYLHRREVIHRDLKPENVLVVDGQAKVLDFGLAVRRGTQTDEAMAGTLHYMAPETLATGELTASSDLYAVGVMAYQLVAGCLPFDDAGGLEDFIQGVLNRPVDVSTLPVPDELASVLQRLLAKTAYERYADADASILALCVALGQQPPAETVALRESFIQAADFVGRKRELTQLTDALHAAINGQGSAWLVGGESGVGKSRLLDELRTQALVEGALVVRGQAVEGGGLTYQLWREPLRRLVLSVELNDLEAGILKAVVPEISTLLERDIPDAPELPGPAGQQRLIQTLVDVIQRQPKPTVLLLEDLQWSEESLEPLKQLTPLLRAWPLLIVANFRSDERPHLSEELSNMQMLRLERLSAGEIAELSAGMLGEGGRNPALVERLHHETEGNTYFMVEIVRALAETAGRLDNVGGMKLPISIFTGGIQKIIRRRLERVPSWGQRLLKLAAVAGRQLELPVIHTLLATEPSLGDHALDEWLRACADVTVLEIADEQWRFAHDKLREAVLVEVEEESARLHRAVAEALEQVYQSPEARAPYHEVLLSHWQKAGDPDRELFYLEIVTRQMVGIQGAHEQADPLITRALGLLDEDDRRRPPFLNSRAESLWRRAEYEAAQAHAQMAYALAVQLNIHVESLRSLNALAIADERRGNYEAALAYYQESLSLSREINDKRAIGRNLIGFSNVSYYLGRYEDAEKYIQDSLAIGRELNDIPGVATCLNNLGVYALERGAFKAAESYFEESANCYLQIGHREGSALTLNNRGNAAVNLGDDLTAERCFRESLSIYQSIGSQRGIALTCENLGGIALLRNDYAEAERFLQQSLELNTATGDKAGISTVLSLLGDVDAGLHQPEAADAHYQESLMLARTLSDPTITASILSSTAAFKLEYSLPNMLDELSEGLEISLNIGLSPVLLGLLVSVAWCSLEMGQVTESARLVGLIQAHPATPPETRKGRLPKLLERLHIELSKDVLNMHLAAGASMDLDATAQAWLEQLKVACQES